MTVVHHTLGGSVSAERYNTLRVCGAGARQTYANGALKLTVTVAIGLIREGKIVCSKLAGAELQCEDGAKGCSAEKVALWN